jgi:hypothetical protein
VEKSTGSLFTIVICGIVKGNGERRMKSDWAESIEKLIKNSPNPSMRKIEEGFVLFEKIKNIIKGFDGEHKCQKGWDI